MKIFRIIASVFLIFTIVFTIFFAREKLSEDDLTKPKEYKAVLTVWHIDVFEGGTGSRKQFIEKVSKTFEKENEGVFVLVSSHTIKSLEERFEKGEYPDVISFGQGVQISNVYPIKIGVETFGKIGGETYAVPWCRGGYVMIENPSSKSTLTVVSQAEFTQPLICAQLNGIKLNDFKIYEPMDAYVSFVSGKAKYLLGTQRDVIRLQTRGMQVKATSLCKFSDLYQYLSITKSDNFALASEFIEYMLSSSVQESLYKIAMQSHYVKVESDNITLNDVQNQKITTSLSPFYSPEELKDLQKVSLLGIRGDENSQNKIKKMLVNLEK